MIATVTARLRDQHLTAAINGDTWLEHLTAQKLHELYEREDAKKAPAGATAGTENLINNNIYPSIVSNRLGIRKVETK